MTMTLQEARLRNHRIMRLRGVQGTALDLFAPSRAAQIVSICDDELRDLGALTLAEQRAEMRRKWEKLGAK